MEPKSLDPAERAGLHVAVVFAADGIRFLWAARTGPELVQRLADYVQRQADAMLYEEEALQLRQMLDAGVGDGAVRWYFERVGRRWEQEFLHCEVIPDPGA